MLVGRLKEATPENRVVEMGKVRRFQWQTVLTPLHLFNNKFRGTLYCSYQKVSSSSRDLAWSVDLFSAITEVPRALFLTK